MLSESLGSALAAVSLTKTELARRAGLSRTTTQAVSEDPSRTRISTLREIALALGYDLSIDLEPASDPLAAAAARQLLGDLAPAPEYAEWVERLKRYSPEGHPLAIVEEAAKVSSPQDRRGSVMLSGRNDADRLVSAGLASGSTWALSGGAALEALGTDAATETVVFWTDDVKQVAELLGATHRRVNVSSAADVIVAPAHPSVFDGAGAVEDVVLVSPVQAIIDSYGVGGSDRLVAQRIADGW